MKSNPMSFAGTILLLLLFHFSQAQFGTTASAVWITDCNQSNYFNTSGSLADEIGPNANAFNNNNFGTHTQNSGTLLLRGGAVKTFKTPATGNVCAVTMFYRVYLQSGVPGAFSSIDLPLFENCNTGTGQFPSGGPCVDGGQRWQRVIPIGASVPYAPVNLTSFAPGNYVVDVYFQATGSQTNSTDCADIVNDDNAGNYYKAFFSIQAPTLSSTNPSTCNGTEGSITISGLTPGATYQIAFTDNGSPVASASYIANGSGQVTISGLNAGLYANFSLVVNGCTTNLNTGVILSNPIFIPTFSSVAPFCAGTTPPTLPAVSNNGLAGTWSPAVVDNTTSGTYTFTPTSGTCGIPVTVNITVIPNETPTFSFGTSQTICDGGSVPVLPGISANGYTGTWSPAVVDNTTSGTYTFTPDAGQCATTATFTVTVNPNITPTFLFGSGISICAGDTPPALPATSTNGINGTWSPASIDNTTSGTYTFTPTAGQCATPTSMTVTVDPVVPPVFSFGNSQNICIGGTVPVFPNTSDNGINGTWSPAVVDNTTSGTYTFTPGAGQCTTPFVFSVTIDPNITPTFSFGTSLTICEGATVPTLPGTSDNGITGSWSPAVVDNTTNGTYTFTPDAGQCAIPASFSVTVNPNITPTFTFGTTLTICAGESVPALPTSSSNGITGTWSPATVDNTTSGTYTFTPTAGLCATPATFTVTVNPIVTPTFAFGNSLNLCAGGSAPALPGTSDNGITGTWSPATVDNTTNGTYTFTPTAGQCADPFTLSVTVNPNITPTFSFGTSLTICDGETVPVLPGTSDNGYTGTWSPAVVDNTTSGTYTFTPTVGQCATPTTFTVTVNPILTPTFAFGTSFTACEGSTMPALPATSDNGVTGSWSPAVIDNTTSGTYTFTPTSGQCAVGTTLTVTIDPNITPVFSIGSSLTICAGASVPVLPGTSDNGVTGTWSPAVVDNTTNGTYTFTPTAGLCALPFTFNVTVNPNITPTFSFGTSLSVCDGATVPTLPGTSNEGITGTWSPAVIDNTTSGTYTFTPDAGLCAVTTTLTVTVNPILTPTFDFGTSITICEGSTAPVLVNTSNNGIQGTWSPATVDNMVSGTYTFTPDAGQCGTPTTLTVTIEPNITPVFSFGSTLTICAGGTVPTLPNTSDNGITGTWSPAVVNTNASGTYTFTPTAGLCALPVVFTVTVNPILTPAFAFGLSQSICIGGTVPTLPASSTNGITGTWSPAVVDNTVSGTYTFTPDAGQCANTASFNMEVNPIPVVTVRNDTLVYDGNFVPGYTFTTTPAGSVNWTNNNTAIGLGASGTGNMPSFTATNLGSTPITGTVTVTPNINGCVGQARQFVITVNPLNKDVFVPNVFSPNGDGKNEVLYVYGNYIDKLEMRIFNQWGQQIAEITNKSQGWDGKHKGTPQPVGVYVYVLKAELADGRVVNLKGSITLVR